MLAYVGSRPGNLLPRSAVTCCAAALLLPSGAFALQRSETPDGRHAAVLAANVGAGALTAGVRALIEGDDFSRAVARGALGGALGYAGKRIAVER